MCFPPRSARRVRPVHPVESQKAVSSLKLKFPASLISKFKFEGRFEELSASLTWWHASQHLKLKLKIVTFRL